MRVYTINAEDLVVSREAPARPGQNQIVVASLEELRAARLNGKRLLALWNGLPGVDRLSKVGNREALVDRLWSALEALPDPRPVRASKQAEVIGLLRRPEGVTVDEGGDGVAAAHRARRLLGRPEEEARARNCRGKGRTRPGLPHRRGRCMTPVPRYEKVRRETGGLFRRADLAAGSPGEGSDIEVRIIALEALTTAELQIEWRRLYRVTSPTRLSRDLLIRGVAHRVQEQAHGGLSLSTKRRLRSLSDGADQRGGSAAAPAIKLKPGTKLVREWHGHVHIVNVLEDGFEYQGERFRSLTRIARQITGVHWSGPLFFGISKRLRVVSGAADE